MADSYALALQLALIARLDADTAIGGLVSDRIYDQPPASPVRPFIRIGDIEPRPFRTSCGSAATVTFGVEAYSRTSAGRVEATQCAEAIVASLDGAELNVAGFDAVYCRWITQTVDPDGDGGSHSAIVVFETLLDG